MPDELLLLLERVGKDGAANQPVNAAVVCVFLLGIIVDDNLTNQ
jgi:hypothetical protein